MRGGDPMRTPDPKQHWLTFVHNHAKVIVECDFFVVVTAAFREALPGDHLYRFLIHDRDSIFSKELDQEVTAMGWRVLRTPMRAPKANSVCERLGGSLRRECLDFLIPMNQRHLKMTVKEWGVHYNRGRPHSSWGPGTPAPNQDSIPASDHRHKLLAGYRVVKTNVPGGLHHEYHRVKEAA